MSQWNLLKTCGTVLRPLNSWYAPRAAFSVRDGLSADGALQNHNFLLRPGLMLTAVISVSPLKLS